MRNILRLLGYSALFAAVPTSAVAASSKSPVLRDGSHDMDFAIGTWRTDIVTIKDPFERPDQTMHLSGTKTARQIWGGKAVIEEIEAEGPRGRWEAANLYLYDPTAHQWNQHYVDSSDGRFAGPPGVGEYRSGSFEFYWQTRIVGRAILERGIWAEFTPISHTYRVERSNDGGRSWHPSFIAHLTKIN